MALEAARGVQVVAPGRTHAGKQGFTYGTGATRATVGAQGVSMAVLALPPGARAKVHLHEGIETIALLLEGECTVHYGARLEAQVTVRAGEQVYLPPDMPHAPSNESGAACRWVVVHSSGDDQDGIVMLPALDEVLVRKVARG